MFQEITDSEQSNYSLYFKQTGLYINVGLRILIDSCNLQIPDRAGCCKAAGFFYKIIFTLRFYTQTSTYILIQRLFYESI